MKPPLVSSQARRLVYANVPAFVLERRPPTSLRSPGSRQFLIGPRTLKTGSDEHQLLDPQVAPMVTEVRFHRAVISAIL